MALTPNIPPANLDEDAVHIVGLGPAALFAAEAARAAGKKVYVSGETSKERIGGKVQTVNGDDFGAEFVDGPEKHKEIWDACDRHGIKLVECEDQKIRVFQTPDGKSVWSEKTFMDKDHYGPLQEAVNKLAAKIEEATNKLEQEEVKPFLSKKEKEDLQAFIAKYDHMPATQMLLELAAKTEVVKNRSTWQKFSDTVMMRSNRVDPQIAKMAAMYFSSEAGLEAHHPKDECSALHYINETSRDPSKFIESGCNYRFPNGAQELYNKMRDDLEAKGVVFNYNHKLTGIDKAGDSVKLSFKTPEGQKEVTAPRTILAIPHYAIGELKGVEKFFSEKGLGALRNADTTNWMKITVGINPDVKIPKVNFYSVNGFQCWPPKDNKLSFLIDSTKLVRGEIDATALAAQCMKTYAMSFGTTADKIFNSTVAMTINAIKQKGRGCSGTNGLGNITRMETLYEDFKRLGADHRIGVANSSIPCRAPDGTEIVGFMGSAAVSGKMAYENLIRYEQQKGHSQQITLPAHIPTRPLSQRQRINEASEGMAL